MRDLLREAAQVLEQAAEEAPASEALRTQMDDLACRIQAYLQSGVEVKRGDDGSFKSRPAPDAEWIGGYGSWWAAYRGALRG